MLARQPLSISTLKLFLGLLVTFLAMGMTDGWPLDYYLTTSEIVSVVVLLAFPFFISRDCKTWSLFILYGCVGALPIVASLIPRWLRYGYTNPRIEWEFRANVCLVIGGSALACLLSAIAGSRFWRKWDPKEGFCSICGYNLTANVSGTCPECGTRIPPQQAASGARLSADQPRSTAEHGAPKRSWRLAIRRAISAVSVVFLFLCMSLWYAGNVKFIEFEWSLPVLNLLGGCRVSHGAIEILHLPFEFGHKWYWDPLGVGCLSSPNEMRCESPTSYLWRARFYPAFSYVPLWIPCFAGAILAIASVLPTTSHPRLSRY